MINLIEKNVIFLFRGTAGQGRIILSCPRNLSQIENLSCGTKIHIKSVPRRDKIRRVSPEIRKFDILSYMLASILGICVLAFTDSIF